MMNQETKEPLKPSILGTCIVETTLDTLPEDIMLTKYTVDNPETFFPVWKRMPYLYLESGKNCEGKRCMSPTELEIFFSSFPCSNCPSKQKKMKNFIGPSVPCDVTSTWFCTGCEKKCNFLRALDLIRRVECEVADYIHDKDVFGLMKWMRRAVDVRLLHWNQWLVFNASILMFKTLWSLLNANELTVMDKFGKQGHEIFKEAAGVILNLTKIFQQHAYQDDHVIPLRLAGILRLRELTMKFKSRATNLAKLESVVTSIYFRTKGLTGFKPLFEIMLPDSKQDGYLKALELMMLHQIWKAAKFNFDRDKLFESPHFGRFLTSLSRVRLDEGIQTTEDSSPFAIFGTDAVRIKAEGGLFPWAVQF